jgi:hypothetical protein
MRLVGINIERLIEKNLFAFPPTHFMTKPILGSIGVIPAKPMLAVVLLAR